MCGICGIAHRDHDRPVSPRALERMRDLLAHRGPDDAGTWCQPGVGLGHRRLSIIDLQGGHQPMASAGNTICVTYNGEIYNYRELMRELRARGYRFRTRCDTEVLVHGYEEYGLDLPAKLNGIFAFAIYDTKRKRLVLARDHLGVKPLFYAIRNDTLAFASEVKAVLAALAIEPAVSETALQEYLVFRYVTDNQCFFKGISRLPPGHTAVWQNGALTVRSYWSPSPGSGRRTRRAADVLAELDHHLRTAVRRQMMSDVPLGAFCSGGVDSGLTTSYAAGASEHQLKTFAVGFTDTAWDESGLALDTARRFQSDHHSIIADASRIFADIKTLIWYNDEPLSHPNSVPLYHLSKLARQHVTVVLTGEGADELFCGYPRYQIARFHGALSAMPTAVLRLAAVGLRMTPGHRAYKLADLIRLDPADAMLFNSRFIDSTLVERLTRIPLASSLARRRQLVQATKTGDDWAAWLSRYELLTYLVSALDRIDRVSMAVGLEARVPFLDIDLVEWGLQLPLEYKLRGTTTKYLLRKLAARKLSPRIVHGAKSGFGLPLDAWFRKREFRSIVDELLDANHPAARHFDLAVLKQVIDHHDRRLQNHGELLWLLVNVYLWYDVHIGARLPQDHTDRPPHTDTRLRPVL